MRLFIPSSRGAGGGGRGGEGRRAGTGGGGGGVVCSLRVWWYVYKELVYFMSVFSLQTKS